jgi:general secretion pathway protein E
MVGEIRDIETAGISIHAALTGHFLFSTLHTNDAASAVTRLIDMGVEHYLVASTLVGVMAQRLVRRICPHCVEEYAAPADVVREFGERFATLRRGRGCDSCMGTGYRGRISIFELLIVNDGIRDLIMREATAREIMQRAVSEGMRTLRDDGLRKVMGGITTIEEVFRVTQAEVAY